MRPWILVIIGISAWLSLSALLAWGYGLLDQEDPAIDAAATVLGITVLVSLGLLWWAARMDLGPTLFMVALSIFGVGMALQNHAVYGYGAASPFPMSNVIDFTWWWVVLPILVMAIMTQTLTWHWDTDRAAWCIMPIATGAVGAPAGYLLFSLPWQVVKRTVEVEGATSEPVFTAVYWTMITTVVIVVTGLSIWSARKPELRPHPAGVLVLVLLVVLWIGHAALDQPEPARNAASTWYFVAAALGFLSIALGWRVWMKWQGAVISVVLGVMAGWHLIHHATGYANEGTYLERIPSVVAGMLGDQTDVRRIVESMIGIISNLMGLLLPALGVFGGLWYNDKPEWRVPSHIATAAGVGTITVSIYMLSTFSEQVERATQANAELHPTPGLGIVIAAAILGTMAWAMRRRRQV